MRYPERRTSYDACRVYYDEYRSRIATCYERVSVLQLWARRDGLN